MDKYAKVQAYMLEIIREVLPNDSEMNPVEILETVLTAQECEKVFL